MFRASSFVFISPPMSLLPVLTSNRICLRSQESLIVWSLKETTTFFTNSARLPSLNSQVIYLIHVFVFRFEIISHYFLCVCAEEIMLEPDASKYFFINQGMLTIDKLDDASEMRDTKKAFDILMFTQVIHKL